MSLAVVDASAVIALLLGEPGGEKLKPIIADCTIATVNLAEVVGYFARNGAAEPVIREMIGALHMQVAAFNDDLAYAAGLLAPTTRAAGLSLGDRACLALARGLRVRAITTDRSWLRVAEAVAVEIELIR